MTFRIRDHNIEYFATIYKKLIANKIFLISFQNFGVGFSLDIDLGLKKIVPIKVSESDSKIWYSQEGPDWLWLTDWLTHWLLGDAIASKNIYLGAPEVFKLLTPLPHLYWGCSHTVHFINSVMHFHAGKAKREDGKGLCLFWKNNPNLLFCSSHW